MKINRFLSILAGAALFAGCTREAPVNDPQLAVDINPSYLTFDGTTEGESEIVVSATAAWTAAVPSDASWITLTPASGGIGDTKVKVSVAVGGEKARKAEIPFKAADDTKYLTVEQSGGEVWGTLEHPYTCAKAIETCLELADRGTTSNMVYVKGIIVSVVEKFGVQFGNATFFMSDDGKAESPQFEAYRVLYLDNVQYADESLPNISVGDEVILHCTFKNYGGQAENDKGYIYSFQAGSSPVLSVEKPAAEILADETEATFAVEAKNVAKWTVAAKESYDWVSDYTKEGTESGDITVKVAANTAAEARTAVFTVAADGVNPVEITLTQKGASVASTVAELTAQITSTDRNNPSAYSANLKGAVVSYVNGANAYIEDESGAILYYKNNHGLTAGQKVSGVVKGTGYLYNGLPEITEIGTEVKVEDGGTIPQTEMTIANLLANYNPNFSRRIILKGVTVKDAIADGDRNGVVAQGGAEIAVYAGLNNKGLVLTEGATGDLVCFPTIYINSNSGTTTLQLSFWDNDHFTGTGPVDPQPSGIKTADELIAWLADGSADATLAADIDLSGKTFTPAAEIKGSLDGNGKTITVKDQAAPVIPVTSGAVKNVTFAGSFAAADATAKLNLAPIGKSTGAIENVTNKAAVTYTGAAPAANSGVTVAGIVAEAYGSVKGCTNEAKITVNAAGKDTYGLVAAGIAGFLGASLEGCDNKGEIYLAAGSPLGRTSGMTELTLKYDPAPACAGIAAYAIRDDKHTGTSVKQCNNNAKVTFIYDNLSSASFAVSRTGVTGIVGHGGCPITNCSNTGDIELKAVCADRSAAFTGVNIILHAAGIHGDDYYVKVNADTPSTIDQDETTITDCTNSGKIHVDSDLIQSNSAIGGISGWPAAENAKTVVSKIKNCTNTGEIVVDGLIKVRAGGIAGGTTFIEDCKNSGNILVNNADATSVFGLIDGFHTQPQSLKNCEANGKIEAKVKVNGIGGLCGGVGDVANTFGQGCKVNATLIGSGTEQIGLVVGHLNGTSKAVTIGTAEEPVLVAGSVNGVQATADNYQTLIQHAANYKEGTHVFNVKFGN